jgi:ABC-type transport system involved in Fe-S cluster assembly fused permease/ATPase subunit
MMLDVALTSALLLNSFGFPFVCTFVLTHFSYALFTVKYSNVKRNNQNEYSSGEKALDR